MLAKSRFEIAGDTDVPMPRMQASQNVNDYHDGENGRAGEIRTHDLLHPMQARYQATLQPEQKDGHKAPCPDRTQALFLRHQTIQTFLQEETEARIQTIPFDHGIFPRMARIVADSEFLNPRLSA